MCVILDASVRDDVFGTSRTPAGKQFFEWLESARMRRTRLVLGGKLTDELSGSRAFEKWAETALADGRVKVFDGRKVDTETDRLKRNWSGRSDDQHVIALARVSGARVLYADDGDLRHDFGDTDLVSRPQGKLLPMGESAKAGQHRRKLLGRTDLCPNQ